MARHPDRPRLRRHRPGHGPRRAGRAGGRLDAAARAALPVYADGASLVLAVLAVALPPLSVVALVLCVWLLLRRRRRAGEKYAGLRILR